LTDSWSFAIILEMGKRRFNQNCWDKESPREQSLRQVMLNGFALNQGNISATARWLKMSREVTLRKLHEFGLYDLYPNHGRKMKKAA